MDEAPTLILVDDDPGLCSLMADFFAEHGYRTEIAHNGREALTQLYRGHYDLAILDVMLPGIDGFEVLQQVRAASALPIIMLTACTSRADRISGLNLGADDYLPKPFEPEELLARVRAVLRRAARTDIREPSTLEICGVRLNASSRQAWLHGDPVSLTAIEFNILACLMRSAGSVVSRDALASALHQRQATPYERAIDVHICHLRRKLDPADIGLIRTIRGTGYIFLQLHGETK